MKGIGILPGKRFSQVDHLVPLCQIMKIPLLCTDPTIKEWVEIFYPEMEIFLDEAWDDFSLDLCLKDYDTFFYVDHSRNFHGSFQFFEYTSHCPARSVCGLHGNSDKKRNLFWIERFLDEDIVLLYGQYMIDFLREKGIWERMKNIILVGNYRWKFYQENQSFFDTLAKPLQFPRQSHRKTVLYAPTWTSPNLRTEWREDYSSFFAVYQYVLDKIPEEFQIYVKIHPHFILHYPQEVQEIKQKYQESERIIFLNDIPLIYPFLQKVDFYIGDYSSIGYDFLSFNRPLFFININQRNPLYDRGVLLYLSGNSLFYEDLSRLYQILDRSLVEDPYKAIREKMYTYTFIERSLEEVKQQIEELLH
jgi:hypothetical protein